MKIIAVTNQKGGVGKSTIAIQIAHGFHVSALRVALIDADPQGTTKDFADIAHSEKRIDGLPAIQHIPSARLDAEVKKLKQLGAYDVVVIDVGAGTHDNMASTGPLMIASAAIRVADLVLVPLQASAMDAKATKRTIALVQARQADTGGRPKAAMFLSNSKAKSALARDVSEDYGAVEGFTFLNTVIAPREVFKTSYAKGQTVFDLKDGHAAREEIEALLNEIETLLVDEVQA